jgi:hypothetical protein
MRYIYWPVPRGEKFQSFLNHVYFFFLKKKNMTIKKKDIFKNMIVRIRQIFINMTVSKRQTFKNINVRERIKKSLKNNI